MCVTKFLGCIPHRVGCLVLAYLGLVSSFIVVLVMMMNQNDITYEYQEAIRKDDFSLVYEEGDEHLTKDEEKVAFLVGFVVLFGLCVFYYLVHGLFILFSIFLAVGAHQQNVCLVKTYFVYGFFHFFFMLFLASYHYYLDEYFEAAITVIADVFFMFCLAGVKGFSNSITNGQVYSQPGVTYKA